MKPVASPLPQRHSIGIIADSAPRYCQPLLWSGEEARTTGSTVVIPLTVCLAAGVAARR